MPEPSSPPPLPARLDDLLCFMVQTTGFAFNRVYRKPLAALGLTYSQYLVMLVLWADDGLTVGQIGARMRLDSGTITPLLKRLETLGLVIKRRSAQDERRVVVTLTRQGAELRDRAGAVVACLAEALAMDEARTASLLTEMQGLRDRLEHAAA